MYVHGGQDPVVLAQQPVQHEQGQGWGSWVRIDDDVFQRPEILGGQIRTMEPAGASGVHKCVSALRA